MFKTDKFEVKAKDDFIIQVTFYNGANIELADAELINEHLIKLTHGKRYCVYLDAQQQFTTSPESRAFVANKSSDRIAFAIITKSIANKLVGNFFIQFNKPNIPTKLFSDEEAALEWLKGHISIHNSLQKEL